MTDATTLPPEDDDEVAGNLDNEVSASAPKAPKAAKPAKAVKAKEAAVTEVIPAAKRVKIILE